jgi:hypothetical protein
MEGNTGGTKVVLRTSKPIVGQNLTNNPFVARCVVRGGENLGGPDTLNPNLKT